MTGKQRFESKYKKNKNSCWEWLACLRGKSGYGCMKYKGKVQNAHRISWQLYRGEIPVGMLVCHKCDNRKCVNPDHLFLGSYRDNIMDAIKKGRIVIPNRTGHIATNRKLTKEQVQEIRSRGAKVNKYALGRKYNVDEKVIREILKNTTYKEV